MNRALLPLALALAATACRAPGADRAEAAAPEEAVAAPEPGDAAAEADGPSAEEVRRGKVAEARLALEAGTWEGGALWAAATRTSVMNMPAWPDDPDSGVEAPPSAAYRLGYLRHGSRVPYFPDAVSNDDCPDGWLELLQGGYVCGKYTSPDPKAPSVKFAANPPKLDDPMPYKYGYALVDNTPVYRRVLSLMDRRKYEPELIPAPPDAGAGEGGAGDGGGLATGEGGAAAPDETDVPSDDTVADRPDKPVEKPALASGKGRRGKDARDSGAARDASVLKLADLKGRGVLVRRMKKGFFVALDRAFNAAHARWWRTAEGFAIPFEKIALQTWTPDFHGSWVKKVDAALLEGGDPPEGNGTAALVSSQAAARYVENAKGRLGYTTPLSRWTAVELAGEPRNQDGVVFDRTTSGFWVRHADLLVATPEPPGDLEANEKWIDVDLGKQMLVAFEGTHPVFGTRVSSGRKWTWDPTHDHPTPTGSFRIYEKHISTTMDGDVASDGPYSIEDVPWVMYFQGSYALHGAFWHNYFGSTRSHGCVNMSPADARELFFWTEPTLPDGWHGVFQTVDKPGTRVIIHEPPAPKAHP